MENNYPKCSCPHHSMVPVFIIILGLVLLAHALGFITDELNAVAWPAIIVLIGLQKFFGKWCRCCGRP